jgi:hypothetical protein
MKKPILWATIVGLLPATTVWAQAKYPQWPYPPSYDSAKAAPENNKLLYENDKLRLFEVMIRPGEREPMNGQPYPAAYLYDDPLPDAVQVTDRPLDPKSNLNGQGAARGMAPPGMRYPTCETLAPLAPHQVTNNSSFPIHYYRLEFKRLDGADLGANWQTWYPWMVGPIPAVKNLDPATQGPPFSKDWPYPITMDSPNAAPNNHKILYADKHTRLVEVTERAQSQENLHGHPYYSVFINDSIAGPVPVGTPTAKRIAQADSVGESPPAPLGAPGPYHKGEDGDYHEAHPAVAMQIGKPSGPPAGMISPSCTAASPQQIHAHINGGEIPGHFYRFEFLRLDGDAFKTKWREWYQ